MSNWKGPKQNSSLVRSPWDLRFVKRMFPAYVCEAAQQESEEEGKQRPWRRTVACCKYQRWSGAIYWLPVKNWRIRKHSPEKENRRRQEAFQVQKVVKGKRERFTVAVIHRSSSGIWLVKARKLSSLHSRQRSPPQNSWSQQVVSPDNGQNGVHLAVSNEASERSSSDQNGRLSPSRTSTGKSVIMLCNFFLK